MYAELDAMEKELTDRISKQQGGNKFAAFAQGVRQGVRQGAQRFKEGFTNKKNSEKVQEPAESLHENTTDKPTRTARAKGFVQNMLKRKKADTPTVTSSTTSSSPDASSTQGEKKVGKGKSKNKPEEMEESARSLHENATEKPSRKNRAKKLFSNMLKRKNSDKSTVTSSTSSKSPDASSTQGKQEVGDKESNSKSKEVEGSARSFYENAELVRKRNKKASTNKSNFFDRFNRFRRNK